MKTSITTTIFIIFNLMLMSCNNKGEVAGESPTSPTIENNFFPYNPDSPYKQALTECVNVDDVNFSCGLDKLPLIGQIHKNPTEDNIMDRVLVSHQWMGLRFQEVLKVLPDDIKTLFKPVTMIVIGSEIRPSYYWTGTAAIYLDPDDLWLKNDEKATISQQQDSRANYGKNLSFVFLWRSVKDNDYAWRYYSLTGNEERELKEILYTLANLLYHELTHANDFVPPDQLPSLSREQSVFEAILKNDWLSNRLYLDHPLSSKQLESIAQVLYGGEEATEEEKNYAADYVGALFNNDSANHLYSYYTRREDFALLFQAALMKKHFDIDIDIAFTNKPDSEEAPCDKYLVAWGERNRIGHVLVKNRSQFVVENILPDYDWSSFFENMESEKQMATNQSWCDNLALNELSASHFAHKRLQEKINPNDFLAID